MQEKEKREQFILALVKLNQTLVALFNTGDVSIFERLNDVVEEMYKLQHGSQDEVLNKLDAECNMIYKNFDMIVSILNTTENGVIDEGAQTALNAFLHNIDRASVRIAAAVGLV